MSPRRLVMGLLLIGAIGGFGSGIAHTLRAAHGGCPHGRPPAADAPVSATPPG